MWKLTLGYGIYIFDIIQEQNSNVSSRHLCVSIAVALPPQYLDCSSLQVNSIINNTLTSCHICKNELKSWLKRILRNCMQILMNCIKNYNLCR